MAVTGSEPLQPDTKCSFPLVSWLKETIKAEGGEKKLFGSKLYGVWRDLYSDGILCISRLGEGQHKVLVCCSSS